MTVHDLMTHLRLFDPELPVTVLTDENGCGQELPIRAELPITTEGGGAAPQYVAINVTL
jgi:hypothetical protein